VQPQYDYYDSRRKSKGNLQSDGDIDATLECEGYSKRMELELLKYVNLLYSKL
jgi:hypothetical protein